MKVSNTLGVDFFENVYENAPAVELSKAGLVAEQQKQILVPYDNVVVGDYSADILVNGCVDPHGADVELSEGDRAARRIDPEFRHAQVRYREDGPVDAII
jgi:hypothetical protein